MPASFQFSESNGSGPTPTDGITNLNFGSIDDKEIVPASHPVVAGNNSYEKNIRIKFTGSWTEISNMKFWKYSGDYVTDEIIKANEVTTYVQPVETTSTRAVDAIPIVVGSAIVIHSYEGADTITYGSGVSGYSRYICLQLQTTSSTPAGSVNQKTFRFQYDEV